MFASSSINVAHGLPGDGSQASPWRLTAIHLERCVAQLSWSRKTVFFPAGIYKCDEPIWIDFGTIFVTQQERDMLREGVRFKGEGRASIIQFDRHLDEGPLFRVWWSRTAAVADASSQQQSSGSNTSQPGTPSSSVIQVPLFFWEFTGLNIKGECNCALVELGGTDLEETPWNSCDFQLAVNNGYRTPESDVAQSTGPARGVVIRRALESSVYLVATCAKGIAAVLESCEFCNIRGSFSNAEVANRAAPSGFEITTNSIGLFMKDCCSNSGLSVNFEVAFTGLRFVGSCRGNVFNSVISNNCDERGFVVNDDDCVELLDEAAHNLVQCVVRRDVRQGTGRLQEMRSDPSSAKVAIAISKK